MSSISCLNLDIWQHLYVVMHYDKNNSLNLQKSNDFSLKLCSSSIRWSCVPFKTNLLTNNKYTCIQTLTALYMKLVTLHNSTFYFFWNIHCIIHNSNNKIQMQLLKSKNKISGLFFFWNVWKHLYEHNTFCSFFHFYYIWHV